MEPKEQIRERLRVSDVVATYVKLERNGSSLKGRCPFHQERTPSFHVNDERGSYHCFGCHAHGDIFTFVQEIEHIPFIDALKMLADRAGVTLGDMRKNKEDNRLVELMSEAVLYFESNLAKSAQAREYVHERGIAEFTAQVFHIGYAFPEWRQLFGHLAAKGFTPEEIEAAGLVVKTEKGYYDKFRGRIMFPIRNNGGATVGFTGRILPSLVDPTKEVAKYMNTPETPLYHKSKILFGYDTARKKMQVTKEVVVVEGQMDLVMSYQAGIENVIAVSGTAFTDEHVALIKRFCERVILSFDQDKAGQTALMKSARMCLLAGLEVKVIPAISGEVKDPADIIKADPGLWRDAVSKSTHVVYYALGQILEKVPDQLTRMRAVESVLLPLIACIASKLERAYFAKEVAKALGVDDGSILETVQKGVVASVGTVAPDAMPSRTHVSEYYEGIVAYMNWKQCVLPAWIPMQIDMTQFPPEVLEARVILYTHMKPEEQERMFRDYVIKVCEMWYDEQITQEKQGIASKDKISERVTRVQSLIVDKSRLRSQPWK